MRRRWRRELGKGGATHKQCLWCGLFTDGPATGYHPAGVVANHDPAGNPRHISHGYCAGDCEAHFIARGLHDRMNYRLEREGHEPEPTPDEYRDRWEREGRPTYVPEPWEPPDEYRAAFFAEGGGGDDDGDE